MCQRASGSYFLPLANVEFKDFTVTKGALTIYASSPVVERGFCAACGSPLTFHYTEADGISICIGSLDEPDRVAPGNQYGIESTSAHFHGLTALPGETTEAATPPDILKQIQKSSAT